MDDNESANGLPAPDAEQRLPQLSEPELRRVIRAFLSDVRLFSKLVLRRPLRSYQLEPARAIVDSVLRRKGLTFAVVMSRQAGKNELSAQVEAYLMNLFQRVPGAALVKASPTFKPQTVNSRLRLRERLDNPWNQPLLRTSEGYTVQLGHCRCSFFSAEPSAHVVGATANVLLECDEAQDVSEDKWNKDFAPMAASTNATTVFYGTIWTSRTLLARVMRQLREDELRDGIHRVFVVPWARVADELPAYGDYVRREIARLGKAHPAVRTQYLLQEIDEAGRLFSAERLARMCGQHRRLRQPLPGERYALTVDVAGEDEELQGADLRAAAPRKDSTVVTISRVLLDAAAPDDPLCGAAHFQVVNRYWWTGRSQPDLYAALLDLISTWQPAYVVVDATGIGAGLASFLAQRLGSTGSGGPLQPFEFTAASKSDLGWDWLGLIETGRYKEYADDGEADTAQFWREAAACEFQVLPGPGHTMRWGVPDPAVHDDMLVSAALAARLAHLSWPLGLEGEIVPAPDPLAG